MDPDSDAGSHPETDTDADSVSDIDSDLDSDMDSDTGSVYYPDPDSNSDPDSDSDPDTDVCSGLGLDPNSDAGSDPEKRHKDTGTYSDSDSGFPTFLDFWYSYICTYRTAGSTSSIVFGRNISFLVLITHYFTFLGF